MVVEKGKECEEKSCDFEPVEILIVFYEDDFICD